MSIKLYVDIFNEDHSLAITTDVRKFNYNLKTMRVNGLTESPYFSIGRYICLITSDQQILFMDIQKNPKLGLEIMDETKFDNSLKQRFSALIEVYRIEYDKKKNDVELLLSYPSEV